MPNDAAPAPVRPRLRLRTKLLILSFLLALVPIGISGQTLVSLTATELKSSVNDELLLTAAQVADDVDGMYRDTWQGPLLMLRDALSNEALGAKEKLALLTAPHDLSDVVALQLSVEGSDRPLMVLENRFEERLRTAGLSPAATLELRAEQVRALARPSGETSVGELTYLPQLDTWLVAMVVPLRKPLNGRPAWLVARITLDWLVRRIHDHPFQRNGGVIFLVDATGRRILESNRTDLHARGGVAEALQLLASGERAFGVAPETLPSGERVLRGYAFPKEFDWAVLVERDEAKAYQIVHRMNQSLAFWILLGVLVAGTGAVLLAHQLSKPLQRITEVAARVGQGDFEARVGAVHTRDEIAVLGQQMDQMIAGLSERDRVKDIFGRYVTKEVAATLLNSPGGLAFGGERRRVTLMMTDLRGFTSVSERLQPEQVVQMLNDYLEVMVDICIKHQGTINEIIGDALLVIFGAPLNTPDHARQAIACALDMQLAMERVNAHNRARGLPEIEMGIGLNTGDVVVGNIGSSKRTKYGVVGSDVNLASRIESFTVGGQILISEATRAAAGDVLRIDGELQVQPKGVKEPMTLYQVGGISGREDLQLPRPVKEEVQALPAEVALRYTVVEGKDTGGAAREGALLGLTSNEAELRLDPPVKLLTNLKLRLSSGPCEGQELYAKVVTEPAERAGLHRVRFTSVPPPVAAWLEQLRSAPATPTV